MFHDIALILVLIGAINWGFVGIAKFDLIATLFTKGKKFGNLTSLSRIIYTLIGISAVYVAINHFIQMG